MREKIQNAKQKISENKNTILFGTAAVAYFGVCFGIPLKIASMNLEASENNLEAARLENPED